MKFLVNWQTAIKAIRNNRKRSLLTMFGIVIGIASVITIMALGRGFEKDTIKSLTDSDSEEIKVQVNFTPDDTSLYNGTIDLIQKPDIDMVQQVDGVKSADYISDNMDSIYKEIPVKQKKENKQIDLVARSNETPEVGRDLTDYDNDSHQKIALVDSTTAKDLYDKKESALGRGVDIEGHLFTIVGVFEGSELESMFSMPESNVKIPKKSYYTYFDKEVFTNSVEVMIADGYTPSVVTSDVIKKLTKSGTMTSMGEYTTTDTAMLTDGIGKIMSTLTYFISAIAGISLFIAGVGVMNMMYISVSERTKEIGIRRALGATENSIRMQFLMEGVTLTLLGGFVGYIIGIGVAYLIGKLLGISVSIDLFTVSLAIGVSTAIGIVFSVMPAGTAAKKDLIDILR
ncbi:ABC transporter permease [Enterococcus sp. 669A]|uniref:ABC transporter permease n=1 Tax=Candidatus Enterococcus moelleringii TaxID=2815325 RepID=A0ABS3LBD3_9ENTE|nr:ABC transporter permease [Enterococcus sp. 669A]